ncbi:hypothetical protein MKW92_034327 [Papaver armeniacum]|nr:hypothetical protein MKW92_034327 [Papaver armeniacum]
MAKMSMFFCFFLFVLIAMPAASSASRALLQSDTCPRVPTSSPSCRGVVWILCPDGQYAFKPCCSCQRCCPL